jgi:hypothetical protein
MQFCAQDFVTSYNSLDGPATWQAERSALAAVSLRESGRLRLQLRGESMLPTLWPGDVVEIASCSVDDVRPGEIVLALRVGQFFLHRFVTRQPGGFLLRGDSMPGSDPQFPNETLLGRLVSRAEQGQWQGQSEDRDRARPLLPLRPWSWAIGQLLCYWGPVRRFALKLHARRRRHSHESGNAAHSHAEAVSIGAMNLGTMDPGAS